MNLTPQARDYLLRYRHEHGELAGDRLVTRAEEIARRQGEPFVTTLQCFDAEAELHMEATR